MAANINSAVLLHLGLSPTESFDEAVADMIVGGVEDFFQSLLKIHMEKDEAKKVPSLPISFLISYTFLSQHATFS